MSIQSDATRLLRAVEWMARFGSPDACNKTLNPEWEAAKAEYIEAVEKMDVWLYAGLKQVCSRCRKVWLKDCTCMDHEAIRSGEVRPVWTPDV